MAAIPIRPTTVKGAQQMAIGVMRLKGPGRVLKICLYHSTISIYMIAGGLLKSPKTHRFPVTQQLQLFGQYGPIQPISVDYHIVDKISIDYGVISSCFLSVIWHLFLVINCGKPPKSTLDLIRWCRHQNPSHSRYPAHLPLINMILIAPANRFAFGCTTTIDLKGIWLVLSHRCRLAPDFGPYVLA